MIGNLETAALFQADHHQVLRITAAGKLYDPVYLVLEDESEELLSQVRLADNSAADVDGAKAINSLLVGITEANIREGGFTLDSYSMSGSRIEIGSAISSELNLSIKNDDGQFDPVMFLGEEMFVEVGTKDWSTDLPVTYIPLGYFVVDDEPKNGETIRISALDRMVSRFDKEINWDLLSFPMTVQDLAENVCIICGVTLANDLYDFPNSQYMIRSAPSTVKMYRELVQAVAFMTGTCAQFNEYGELRFRWYTQTNFVIDPSNRFSHEINASDIVLTGIHYTDSTSAEYLVGTTDYTLENSMCCLLQDDHPEIALGNILNSVNNFTYRPFTAQTLTAPFLQPLDMVKFVDSKGDTHDCIISHITFNLNGGTSVAGDGDTDVKTNYAGMSGLTDQQAVANSAVEHTANEAAAGVEVAKSVAYNYISTDQTGTIIQDMTDGRRDTPSTATGMNVFFNAAGGIEIRNGQITLATIKDTTIVLGRTNQMHFEVNSNGISLMDNEQNIICNINKTDDGTGFLSIRNKYARLTANAENGARASLLATEDGEFGLYDENDEEWRFKVDSTGKASIPEYVPYVLYDIQIDSGEEGQMPAFEDVDGIDDYDVIILAAVADEKRVPLTFYRILEDSYVQTLKDDTSGVTGSFEVSWTNERVGVGLISGSAGDVFVEKVIGFCRKS